MQSQIQPRQAFIGILMALVAYVYLVNASTLISLRMLFFYSIFLWDLSYRLITSAAA